MQSVIDLESSSRDLVLNPREDAGGGAVEEKHPNNDAIYVRSFYESSKENSKSHQESLDRSKDGYEKER